MLDNVILIFIETLVIFDKYLALLIENSSELCVLSCLAIML